jgi:3-oxoadipate enol-lactonase
LNLRHRIDGLDDAPVLLLANSLGTTLELWAANTPLWRDFRVVRCDARGHGGSDVPLGPYSVDDLGRDALGLLDSLGLDRVSFCGLSIGGATGVWLALNAPERIDRLILACTSARFGDPGPWHERAATVRAEGMSVIVETVVSRWFTPEFATARPEIVAAHREMLAATPAEGYAASCEAVAGWDASDALGEVRAPTLVLAAADDPATPPEHGRVLAEGIPDAELVVISHAAHLANVERPDTFASLVANHLQAVRA